MKKDSSDSNIERCNTHLASKPFLQKPVNYHDYCGKSEKYARQVIMENHRAKCDSLGGNFEGDVYPHELPDESTMYCFSGSCDACETK
jgi:hypothetical protein